MDEQRALLDQLLGKERNIPPELRTNRRRHFTDPDVCKFYLVGICPYALFSNTKSDLGEHPKGEEDDDSLKNMYQALSEQEKEKYGYELDLMHFLEDLVADVDRKVERNRERCNLDNQGCGIPEETLQRLLALELGIREKTDQSEKLAEEGEIDEAQAVLEEVAALRQEKTEIEKEYTSIKTVKRDIVCEVSGNIMSSADNEERIMCHFQGKQYLGWKACREKLKELKEKYMTKKLKKESPVKSARNGQREDRRSRSRDRERKHRRRSRSHERPRRHRSTSRDGRKHRHRRSRSRDRRH